MHYCRSAKLSSMPLTAGEPLLDGEAQGIRQLERPGSTGIVQPVARRLHHIGQGDQPLTAGVQAKEQRHLASAPSQS